jgi:hypothetical protein
MDDTNKIVAAILSAALCAKADSVDMDDYIANYEAIARRLADRENARSKAKPNA